MSERLYAVMTDSHRLYDKTKLARLKPQDRNPGETFWTENNPDEIWAMNRETADEVVSKLHLNNPRVVRLEKATDIIRSQIKT